MIDRRLRIRKNKIGLITDLLLKVHKFLQLLSNGELHRDRNKNQEMK